MTMVMFKFAKKEPLLSLVVGSNPPEYIFFLFSDSRHLVIHYHKLRELKLGNHFIIIKKFCLLVSENYATVKFSVIFNLNSSLILQKNL